MHEQLIIVSGDSHATPPPWVWADYVEARYHDLLPEVHGHNETFAATFGSYANFPPELLAIIDTDDVWTTGRDGVWNLDRRIAEMDREGIAAELVYVGDSRAILPLAPMYRSYEPDVLAAGSRAYDRWLADTFGAASDRLLLVGDAANMVDVDAMLAELDWMAAHDFTAVNLPGMMARHDLPSIRDPYFDPFWAKCAELGLPVVCHAGYGQEQCEFIDQVDEIERSMRAAGRDDLLAEIMNNAERFFSLDLRPRRAMWLMMLSGVFDRHPDLKLIMAEVRADWMPDTLRHLDAAFERERDQVPAQRRPSEYWHANGLTSLSFVHKAEVAMRHEIGLETITFGRDYPHAEGTWPNTTEWLSDAFAGVPVDELRLMLGENAMRFLDLDRAHLAGIASRIGPTVGEVAGPAPGVDSRVLENWNARGGYLKPREPADPDAIDALLIDDLAFGR